MNGFVTCGILIWLFGVGATVGSFLNVVVYRLPRGMSLIHPGSRCPSCGEPIRFHDNVPILAWLWLRGRCRRCSVKIDVRYPVVEAVTAVLFVVLAAVDIFQIGANPGAYGGRFDPLRSFAVGPLWAVYGYHLLLVCTLWCAALMEYDGHRPQMRLYGVPLAIGLLAGTLWPFLRPMTVGFSTAGLTPADWAAGIADGALGAAMGGLLGLALTLVLRMSSGRQPSVRTETPDSSAPGDAYRWESRHSAQWGFFGFVLAGAFLGWQPVTVVGVVTMAFCWPCALVARRAGWGLRRFSWNAILLLTCLGAILGWKYVEPLLTEPPRSAAAESGFGTLASDRGWRS